MKFKDGYMISSGQPVKDYIDSAVRHVLLRQVCFFFFFLHSHLIDFLSALGFSCCWLIFFLNGLMLLNAKRFFFIVL